MRPDLGSVRAGGSKRRLAELGAPWGLGGFDGNGRITASSPNRLFSDFTFDLAAPVGAARSSSGRVRPGADH